MSWVEIIGWSATAVGALLGFPLDVVTPTSVLVACMPFLAVYPVAISNLAFVLVALVIWRIGRGRAATGLQRWFAPLVAVMGACSFVYHASNVWLTQVFDFLGMYLFCCLLLGLNVVRLGWLAERARALGAGHDHREAAVRDQAAVEQVEGLRDPPRRMVVVQQS